MFTELEKKFIFYILDALEHRLYYDEDYKEINCSGLYFQGSEIKDVKSEKELRELIDNIMDKCCK